MIKFIAGIIIQSTLVLALDQFSNNLGYSPYNTDQSSMSYAEAAFFIIESFSTVGYGDIFPVFWVKINYSYLVHTNRLGFYSLYQSCNH